MRLLAFLTVLCAVASSRAAGGVDDRLRERPCLKAIVWVAPGKVLYKDGQPLGAAVKSHSEACNGDVVWIDELRSIYKNDRLVGNDAREYAVAPLSGDAVWKDGGGALWRNDALLGPAATRFEINRWTDDVVWLDVGGGIFKNQGLIGVGARDFDLRPDGRIHWLDAAGQHHID